MRTSMTLIALLLLAIACLLPSTAAAQDVPDAIEDPVVAMEPEIDAGPAPLPTAEPDAGIAAQGGVVEGGPGSVAGIAEANVVAPAPRAPALTAQNRSGLLPFTGVDSGSLTMLFLVGTLLVLGGVTAVSWSRAGAPAT
jgi:hypothetical protein